MCFETIPTWKSKNEYFWRIKGYTGIGRFLFQGTTRAGLTKSLIKAYLRRCKVAEPSLWLLSALESRWSRSSRTVSVRTQLANPTRRSLFDVRLGGYQRPCFDPFQRGRVLWSLRFLNREDVADLRLRIWSTSRIYRSKLTSLAYMHLICFRFDLFWLERLVTNRSLWQPQKQSK